MLSYLLVAKKPKKKLHKQFICFQKGDRMKNNKFFFMILRNYQRTMEVERGDSYK